MEERIRRIRCNVISSFYYNSQRDHSFSLLLDKSRLPCTSLRDYHTLPRTDYTSSEMIPGLRIMCSGNQWLWQVCFLLFVNIVYSRLFNSTERIKQDINPKKKSADNPQCIFKDCLLLGRAGSCAHQIYLALKLPFSGLSYAAHPRNMVMCLSKVRRQVYYLLHVRLHDS